VGGVGGAGGVGRSRGGEEFDRWQGKRRVRWDGTGKRNEEWDSGVGRGVGPGDWAWAWDWDRDWDFRKLQIGTTRFPPGQDRDEGAVSPSLSDETCAMGNLGRWVSVLLVCVYLTSVFADYVCVLCLVLVCLLVLGALCSLRVRGSGRMDMDYMLVCWGGIFISFIRVFYPIHLTSPPSVRENPYGEEGFRSTRRCTQAGLIHTAWLDSYLRERGRNAPSSDDDAMDYRPWLSFFPFLSFFLPYFLPSHSIT